MVSDMVARLRSAAKAHDGCDGDAGKAELIRQAADRIAALEAEASEGERRGLEPTDAMVACFSDPMLNPEWVRSRLRGALALIPAPAREGWQPIETAPRDGSEIILHDRGTVGTGFYSEAPEARRAEAGWFWEDDRGNLLIAKNADPTHWMPLPSPPQDREEQ